MTLDRGSLTDHPTGLRRRVDVALARREALQQQRAEAQAQAEAAQARVLDADTALHILRTVRHAGTQRVQQRVTEIASEVLRVVFGDPSMRLEVVNEVKRNQAEAVIQMRRGAVVTDPLNANGGGLVAQVSAVLRLVMVRMLAPRGIAPVLILDEPFAALSVGHRADMADVLEQVAGSLGIQVLVVTHSAEEQRGRVYEVTWEDRDRVLAMVTEVER